MADLDLGMVLKLKDRATRGMRAFNRTLDKTKKKLEDIGRLQAKNAKATAKVSKGAQAGAGADGGLGAVGVGAGVAATATAAAGFAGLQAGLVALARTAKKFEKTLAAILTALGKTLPTGTGLHKGIVELNKEFHRINLTARLAQKNLRKVGSEAAMAGKKAQISGTRARQGAKGWTKFRVALLAIGAILALAVRSMIQTGREFETLRATLSAVIPKTDNVGEAFAFIQSVAKQLPATVQEVTTAFIRMQALGLAPTEEKLLSFGNTAAASGKSVLQFVEAVADAVVGENERLKEFGIKAKVDGDKVAFTFRGVTTEVENTATAISKFLVTIGKSGAFAGAATKQMDTLDGAISNLGVATDMLSDNIFQAMNPAFKAVISLLTDFVEWTNNAIVNVRKFIVFTIGGFDQLLIKMKAFGQRISFLNADTKKINEERDKSLKMSRMAIELMIKELDALTNIDDAAKKYSKTLDERADAQDRANAASKDSSILIEGEIQKRQTLNEFLQETIDGADAEITLMRNAIAARSELNELVDDGIISQEVADKSLERIDDIINKTDELSAFFKRAFENMQDDLAGFFVEATTKKFSSFRDGMKSLAADFARTINRMVAQWLAAKVLTAGFGIFGADTGGSARGFADGGRPPVNVPSIIGERGPEVFVPDSAGTIIPNEALGGINITTNITSMDGTDAMRVFERNARGIAEMVTGTNRKFNLGEI